MSVFETTHFTPLGPIAIRGDAHAITEVRLARCVDRSGEIPTFLRRCALQLDEYFAGQRRTFRLPLRLAGSAFQRKIYRALMHIPFGSTITYGELARRIRHPHAARAVGSALRRNPLPILVPCHRVIPAAGGIVQYAGGRRRKEWLLHHERGAHSS